MSASAPSALPKSRPRYCLLMFCKPQDQHKSRHQRESARHRNKTERSETSLFLQNYCCLSTTPRNHLFQHFWRYATLRYTTLHKPKRCQTCGELHFDINRLFQDPLIRFGACSVRTVAAITRPKILPPTPSKPLEISLGGTAKQHVFTRQCGIRDFLRYVTERVQSLLWPT